MIATHSPILLALPGALIYHLGEDGYAAARYADLELVGLYRGFLADPDLFLRHLLESGS